MNKSSTGTAVQRRWALVVVAAAVIGLIGCTTGPDVDPKTSPPASNSAESDALGSASGSEGEPAPEGSVGPVEQPVLPVVEGGIDEEIKLPTGFTINLDSVSATEVKAETPGEVSGPAVKVVVQVTNSSAETQNVSSAVVTLETAEGGLGIPTLAGGAAPLDGNVAPLASAKGSYIFMLDPASGRDVTISVNYAAGEPLAKFTGRTP